MDAPLGTEPHLGRPRVMIVEDDALVRNVLRSLVEEDPRIDVVQQVGTAGQAIAYALAHDVDLIVLDHHLADGDSGLEAAAELRRLRPGVRVIVCSADVEVPALASSSSVDRLVSKQQLIHLLTVVQELLDLES